MNIPHPVRTNVAVFDEHRNGSRVFPVPPGALEDALDAADRFARANPAHVAWLKAGAPSIRSEADHLAWFGETYHAATGTTATADVSGEDQLVIG